MPKDIVTVDVSAQLAGFPEDTFGAIVVVGFSGTGTENVAKQYFSQGEVVSDHGSGSDLPDAVNACLGTGAGIVYGILADKTAIVDELISGSNSAPTTTGTLQGTGKIDSKSALSVTVDGAAKTIVYTDVSPPAAPGAGEVAVNTKTKEIRAGTASSGSGAGIKFTYTTIDTVALFDALSTVDYEIIVIADLQADLKSYGILDAFKAHADANTKILPFALASAATVAEAQDLTANLQSRHLYAVAHKSSDDVGCVVAGTIGTRKPWVTLMWKRVPGVSQTVHYTDAQVGKRGQASTFEGGDGTNLGPCNVIIPVAGTLVLSNGLTTDGLGGEFGGWLDVTRTRNWLVSKIKAALSQLRLSREKIPFTDAGLQAIRSTIEAELVSAVGLEALASYTLFVPKASQLLQADKIARRLAGVQIGAVLAGDVHEFKVQLNLTV